MKDVINVISLGAGVQSSTLALMAKHGDITPMPDAAVFADTQHEPAGVYKWLDWLETQLPFPVYRVTKGSLKAEALTVRISRNGNKYTRSAPPAFVKMPERPTGLVYLWGEPEIEPEKQGLMMRQCTVDFKILIIQKQVRKLRREAKVGKVVPTVRAWIGISTDEAHRIKDSRVPYIENVYPLIERGVSRQDCIAWMLQHGYPKPPRSSCSFCPYHDDDEWIHLRDNEPEAFQEAVEFDNDFRKTMSDVTRGVPYLHRSMLPLSEVEFKPGTGKDQFGNECEGICGN
jgi:hypothetical protein